MIKQLHAAGWQTIVHTIGDQATEDTLRAWAEAQKVLQSACASQPSFEPMPLPDLRLTRPPLLPAS